MTTFKCLIIEDQVHAQRILQRYIKEVPYLQLVGTFIAPLEALPYLKQHKVEVLFLDIHLPKISGIDFLKLLPDPPSVILTTAFTEYALEGFELDVVDYLLKPFSFERFLKSIFKIQRISKDKPPIVHQRYLFVRSKHVIQKIKIQDVCFIEAKGDFVVLHTSSNSYIANTSLSDILQRLGEHFIRCHKSFIVHIHWIDKINGNRIKMGEREIPIGRTYRERLLEKLEMI